MTTGPWAFYLELLGMSCCANSQFVTLFPNGNRTDGTEVAIFDTKQSEKIYYFRNYTSASIPPTTALATVIVGPITDVENTVDKDLDTFATITGSREFRINFQSQAVRSVSILLEQITNAAGLGTLEARWAGSDLVFSSYLTIFSVDAAIAKSVLKMPFGDQNLQYVEFRYAEANKQLDVYQVYDGDEGFGISNVNIQVQSGLTTDWFTVDTLPEILPSDGIEEIDTKTIILPDSSLTRIQLVNTDKWVGSVGALLVNPKFT